MAEEAYYSIHPKFHASVDCIIFGFEEGELSLLLLKRTFEPAKGEWSLAGGFVQEGESLDDAARRVVAELTGLSDLYMRQVHTYGDPGRDPGERVLSTAYYALVDIKKYDRDTKIAKASDKVRKGAGEKVVPESPEDAVAYIVGKLDEKHVI